MFGAASAGHAQFEGAQAWRLGQDLCWRLWIRPPRDHQGKLLEKQTGTPRSVGPDFHRVFHRFPQRSPILHSFCTTQHQFPIAIVFAFPHSAHSASVSCIEPAGDGGRAGGDRRFSRVNRREGFRRCASARCGKLGRCGLLKRSGLIGWTRAARFRSQCG